MRPLNSEVLDGLFNVKTSVPVFVCNMKGFTRDIAEYAASVKKSLSEGQNNENCVIFKDYKLSLTDYSSEQITELRESAQHLNKNGKLILVQQDDSFKYYGQDDSNLGDESSMLSDTDDGAYSCRNGERSHQDDHCMHGPVTVDEARYLLSLHNVCINPNRPPALGTVEGTTTVTLPDVIICCNGKDNEHIAVMGLLSRSKTGSGDVKGQGQRSADVFLLTVSCFGPVTSKSSLLTVDQVIQQSRGLSQKENVSTAAFAHYEIVGMTYHEASVLDTSSHAHYTTVALDCSWENVKGMLERPHSAQCTVHVCAVPGDMRSAAYSVYKELAALLGFYDGLRTEELEWNPKESSSGESVEEAVARLIEKEKQGLQRKPDPQVQTPLGNGDTDFDSLLCGSVIPERQDLYFSELLWTVLWSKATCFDDIIQAFSLVFRELKTGELQPIVHSDNHSTLASAIRASYQQEMHTVSTDEVTKLTMLVEIGLDKLRRDYTNFFIASELTTLNQLAWYLQSGDSCKLGEQVSRLQALHNVLEVAVVSVTSLKLPPEHRRALVRSALSYYQCHPHDDVHTFTQSVEASTVQTLYTSYQPSLWRLTVNGSSGTRSSYQLSSKSPLSHITGLDADVTFGDMACGGAFSYYVSHTRESSLSFL